MPVKKTAIRKNSKKRNIRVFGTKASSNRFKLSPKRALLVILLIVAVGIVIKITRAATVPPVLGSAGAPNGYSLKWSDEFNGTALDRTKWNSPKTNFGTGNKEDQCFAPENAQVNGGYLNLIAKRVTPSKYCGTNPEGDGNYHFNSAMLSTRSENDGGLKYEFKYGYVEASIKMPQGNPFWNGFWLVGGTGAGPWPAYGEVDITELVSAQQDISTGTFHYATDSGLANRQQNPNTFNFITKDYQAGVKNKLSGAMSDSFHRYGVLWEKDLITWYIDGFPYRSFGIDGKVTDYNYGSNTVKSTKMMTNLPTYNDPFNKLHTILITNSIGGGFAMRQGYTGNEIAGGGYDNGNLNVLTSVGQTATTLYDYVRVYQNDGTTPDPGTANQPPTVSLSSPTNGQDFPSAPASVTVTASAADANGIKQVEFFDGTNSLGVDMTAPYSITVSAAAGTHSYTAKATDVNATPLTATSAAVSITVSNPVPPATTTLTTPTGLTATASDGKVQLNWNAVTGADNYTVRWGTGGSFTTYSNANGVQFNPTTNSFLVSGLNNGTSYNFSVAARDTTGKYTGSSYSSAANATPVAPAAAPLLPAPTVFKKSYNYNSLIVKWNPIAGASGYNVSTNGAVAQRVDANQITVNGVTSKTFKFSFTTLNADGKPSATASSYSVKVNCSLYFWCY